MGQVYEKVESEQLKVEDCKKIEVAKNLRYKKAALDVMNIESIFREIEEISEFCDNLRYALDSDDSFIKALDGDEDEECEFRMMFSELSAECEGLYNILCDEYVTEHFNDFFVGIMLGNKSPYEVIGYDSYQEDYMHLTRFERELAENESQKRIMRLSKKDILLAMGQCFGIAVSFLNVQRKYDYLLAAFDVVKDQNMSYLAIVKDIESAYNSADDADWKEWDDSVREFEKLCRALPDTAWVS